MIFIAARFRVRPEHADEWPEISREFSEATRAEPGCLWYDWSRSVEDPAVYVLIEGFRDADAGVAHVTAPHFREAQRTLPAYLAETPKIINTTLPSDEWADLTEFAVTGS